MKLIFCRFSNYTAAGVVSFLLTLEMTTRMMSGWRHQRMILMRPCYAWMPSASTTKSFATKPGVAPYHLMLPSKHSAALFQRGHSLSNSRMSSTESAIDFSSNSVATTTIHKETAQPAIRMINLHTIPLGELEAILQSWGHPKYRAKQISDWIHVQGASNIDEMKNIPQALKEQLQEHATMGSLQLHTEQVSKDGTIKRAYRLADGQLIESVLMPYNDGRHTACISSQAGCAQGCVFCATGQMGFSRQLTPDEIFEQVSRFASELAAQGKQEEKRTPEDASGNKMKNKGGIKNNNTPPANKGHGRPTRLSNIVFMGMGEPLANYRNVKTAVQRIHDELGIGYPKITISTVGIVPVIKQLAIDLPQVRLAVSLHCANDHERSALIPANKRNGGLTELMKTLQKYIETTGRRITLEWALIEDQNDTPDTAHQLGTLIHKWLRKDMVHVNVIPLNPTGGYGGSPSGRIRVNEFCNILEDDYRVACTPRVRRGIDINAGCGQLTSEIEKRQRQVEAAAAASAAYMNEAVVVDQDDDDGSTMVSQTTPVWSERTTTNIFLTPVDDDIEDDDDPSSIRLADMETWQAYNNSDDPGEVSLISMEDDVDWQDHEYHTSEELSEAARLINLVKGTVITDHNGIVGVAPKSTQ